VTLFEALRHRAPVRVCQVELAERYDHKHQSLSAGDPSLGLHRMARDVCKHLFRTLAAAGLGLDDGLLQSLPAPHPRQADGSGADSYAVATINGLHFDRHEEERNVQVFTDALRTSIEEFLADPLGAPLVPNWARVWAGVPDAGARLLTAVRQGSDCASWSGAGSAQAGGWGGGAPPPRRGAPAPAGVASPPAPVSRRPAPPRPA